MFETVCYKKPCLKEVIVRIDFSAELPDLATRIPQKIANVALEKFNIQEPRKIQSQELQINPKGVTSKTKDEIEWNYFGKNREKRLAISPKCLFISYTLYKSFEQLKEDLSGINQVMFETYKDLKASRFGLRYINSLEVKGGNVFEWKDYINEKMLGIIDFHEQKNNLSRVLHILEYNFDGLNLRYQFGLPNPDYPSVIKKKQFVLDLDSYYQGPQNFDDINEHLESAHEIIQNFFEKSITDKTRKILEQEV